MLLLKKGCDPEMRLLLEYQRLKNYVIDELKPYWRVKDGVSMLPVPASPWPQEEPLPPRMKLVALPIWGKDIGVEGSLLVPEQFIKRDDDGEDWTKTDWYSVIFWYLNGMPERVFEEKYGSVYSYSYRLKCWDNRLWDHAWVNRVALFLRRWAAMEAQCTEEDVCGPLPKPVILLTHDLDAINKTFAIRTKQSVFLLFNAAKLLLRGEYKASVSKFFNALRFFFILEISITWIKCVTRNRRMGYAA